jgi:structural maintenance of chromosome 3 (chondroitin sulfate proteoglycan 6)
VLWREEKKISENLKFLSESLAGQGRKTQLLGGIGYSAYQEIKGCKGVHGCVYELIDIPDELYDAVESVASSLLFSVVVDDDDVATELIKRISQRLTFIPLNRMRERASVVIKNESAIPLHSQIKCDKIYRPVLRYITRDSYLVPDIKTAVLISKNYNVNCVTVEGDVVSKKGTIAGGCGRKTNFLMDLKKMGEELKLKNGRKREISKRLSEIENEISKLNLKKGVSCEGVDEKYSDNIKAVILFLKQKRKILKEGSANLGRIVRDREELTAKRIRIEREIRERVVEKENTKADLKKVLEQLSKEEEALRKVHSVVKWNEINSRIKELKRKAERLRNLEVKRYNLDYEKVLFNKNVLIEKRNNISKKIGVLNVVKDKSTDEYFNEDDIKSLYSKLKKVNDEIKKYSTANKRASSQYDEYVSRKERLCSRMEELRSNRTSIEEFIEELDNKKEEAINLMFSMLKDNFLYFYGRLNPGGIGELVLNEGTASGVSIKINNEDYNNLKRLSGGQKTMLALSLIFSIQKIDPSPFYLFDEIDANLDEQGRIRVCELINTLCKEEGFRSQFILTTFKDEMLGCGQKFYKVNFIDKKSSVEEIDKSVASEFLSDETQPER